MMILFIFLFSMLSFILLTVGVSKVANNPNPYRRRLKPKAVIAWWLLLASAIASFITLMVS